MARLQDPQRSLKYVAGAVLSALLHWLRDLHHHLRAAVDWFIKWLISLSVQHVSGPTELNLQPTDAVVVSLVRDGEAHVETFLQHHFDLGVRHVVLLDNGSVDRTVDRAQQFDSVTVLRSTLPYKDYKYYFKRYLFERFGGGGWCLILDIDERFDFPFSDRLSLSDFLCYLNRQNYTAVVAHMLDLFPKGSPTTWPRGGKELVERCVWYDNSKLSRRDYRDWMGEKNRVSKDAVQLYQGGIRKAAFEVDPWLTKHPLLFKDGGVEPSLATSHACRNAHVADVTCVLYHYKFDRGFEEACRTAVQRENYWNDSHEYKRYLKRLRQNPRLKLKQPTARKLQSVNQLVEEGFLVVPQAYCRFAQKRGEGSLSQ